LNHSKLEDWKNGWSGVELGLKKEEIDHIIGLLQRLKEDADQHFHLSSDYQAAGGLGDIMVYVQPQEAISNMESLGKALAPGDHIDENEV
jgi:hypothetical protein